MEVKSTYKFARVSAKKARDVARAIQGLSVESALDTLNFTPKKSAFLIGKTLKSAVANAENNHDLDADDLMVKEAEQHKDEDQRSREKIEARNRLDTLVFSTERNLSDNRDKLDDAAASELESAITETKSVLGDDNADIAALKHAEERLTQASHKLAEVLYQKPPAGNGQGDSTNGHATSDSPPPPQGDDVVDAEYTEVAN